MDFARIVGLAGDDTPVGGDSRRVSGIWRAEVSGRIDRLTGQSGFLWLGLARIRSVATLVASPAGVRTLPERVRVQRPKI